MKTENDDNERIAEWAGIECQCGYYRGTAESHNTRYWGNCPRHSNGGLPPDYDRDEVAVPLVPMLWDKGYNVLIDSFKTIYGDTRVACFVKNNGDGRCKSTATEPTIASSIKSAVLKMIEKGDSHA